MHSVAAFPDLTRTVLVVGGRGFVGTAVVRRLLAAGRRVHVLDTNARLALPSGATETLGSILDKDALHTVLRLVRPDSVVNLAAFSDGDVGLTRSAEAQPDRTFAVNVEGFRHLLEACVEHHVRRVVWTSSTVVLGAAASLSERLDEDAPCAPRVHYGLSKLLAEQIADYMSRREGMEIVGVRIPLMLGPGLWYQGAAGMVRQMTMDARDGRASTVRVSLQPFDAMHVDDAGEACVRLLRAPLGLAPRYHVLGFTTDYAEIADVLKRKVPGYRVTLTDTPAPIVYPLVSQARFERDLGWRPGRTLDTTLADMLAERSPAP